jgi:hypothetical protein
MNKLEEIFQNNKALLDEAEVKELVLYFERTYKKLKEAHTKLDDFEFKVMHECMNSEVIVKNGKDCKSVVTSILELLNENAK